MKFQMPLTLAFSRNQLKSVKLKLQEAELMKQDKQRQINLKYKSYLNEASSLALQLKAQEAATQANRMLLEAERQKFTIGESSVFMINQREQKYLETLEKLIELKSKNLKVKQAIQWSLGILAS
jgi:outer membrane protein TolC